MGLAYFTIMMVLGSYSGGSFNPFRSLIPAMAFGYLDKEQFLYLLGPLLGSLFSVLLYKWNFIDDDEDLNYEETENLNRNRFQEIY